MHLRYDAQHTAADALSFVCRIQLVKLLLLLILAELGDHSEEAGVEKCDGHNQEIAIAAAAVDRHRKAVSLDKKRNHKEDKQELNVSFERHPPVLKNEVSVAQLPLALLVVVLADENVALLIKEHAA